METEEKVEIKQKKDIKPIWIYIVLQLVISFGVGVLFGVLGKNIEDELNIAKVNLLVFLLSNIITFFVFLLIYWSKIGTDIKNLKKKNIIIVLIVSLLIVAANEFICMIFEKFNVEMNNQEQIIEFLKNQPILVGMSVVIFAPFIEEFVFRYSIGNIIKNNILFVIVSAIAFGIIHGLGIATIVYALIGMALAIIYLKTDKNIIYPIIAHTINNLVGIVMILLSL